jgi:hypothetical protein
MNFAYLTNCTQCDDTVDALDKMINTAEEVPYAEMLAHCDGLLEWSESVGYDPYCDEGLALEDDNHVTYYKSTYLDRPCYFLQWSTIEFIWWETEECSLDHRHIRIEAARADGDRIVSGAASRERLGLPANKSGRITTTIPANRVFRTR